VTPRRYWRDAPKWERKEMTVCIAAACMEKDKDGTQRFRIVMCADWRVSSALGTSDTKLKLRTLAKGFSCLTAGIESEINSIVPKLQSAFKKFTNEIDETNIQNLIRGTLNDRKKEKIDEFIRGRYGISYDDFLSFGKDKFPADVHREAILTLSEITVGCSLIIAGFQNSHFPLIVETTENCRVLLREDFAVIGEGGFLAQSALYQRRHIDTSAVGETVYKAFEAKKYAEEVASVGDSTVLAVLHPDKGRVYVSDEGIEELDDRFKQYGPQPIPSTISEITKFFETD
jgi:hypothetical protein